MFKKIQQFARQAIFKLKVFRSISYILKKYKSQYGIVIQRPDFKIVTMWEVINMIRAILLKEQHWQKLEQEDYGEFDCSCTGMGAIQYLRSIAYISPENSIHFTEHQIARIDLRLIAHELYHTYQQQVEIPHCSESADEFEKKIAQTLLIEGTAEFMARNLDLKRKFFSFPVSIEKNQYSLDKTLEKIYTDTGVDLRELSTSEQLKIISHKLRTDEKWKGYIDNITYELGYELVKELILEYTIDEINQLEVNDLLELSRLVSIERTGT